ncbi:hypothetical protein [Stenotrophomonas maltophilia group sp. RNC7]|uniref:hypothetical protein n=1 Tax=Stenotrophomonas maltophilia group sp. RNC7 TaxID=3071467 RepID=UPI0027E1C54D|nr:hypothetical protein [Stenotrophomonas maltophilia group sp. RNC7]MDQ4682356.1 hypothetical protein [Stenotrophomonas maltophilia group sp. RNC7]
MMLTFRDGLEWVQPQSAAYPSPKACCYFSERELLGLALDSYRAALRGLSPPAGEPWSLEGSAWAGPESFVEGLALELVTRLRRRAYLTGHMIPAQEWSPDDARGAVGTPADMAHGCAAVDAVGPAQGACLPHRKRPASNALILEDMDGVSLASSWQLPSTKDARYFRKSTKDARYSRKFTKDARHFQKYINNAQQFRKPIKHAHDCRGFIRIAN